LKLIFFNSNIIIETIVVGLLAKKKGHITKDLPKRFYIGQRWESIAVTEKPLSYILKNHIVKSIPERFWIGQR
jgi:hypothetical protein